MGLKPEDDPLHPKYQQPQPILGSAPPIEPVGPAVSDDSPSASTADKPAGPPPTAAPSGPSGSGQDFRFPPPPDVNLKPVGPPGLKKSTAGKDLAFSLQAPTTAVSDPPKGAPAG